MKNLFLKKGLSLVELIIYIGIFVTVSGLLTGIFINFIRIQNRESAGAEVSSQLNFVMQKVQTLVKESSNIEISTSSVTSNLKLRMPDSSSADPTCIYLSAGKVRIVQGPDNPNPLLATQNCKADSQASDLTNSRVTVDKLEFRKSSFGVGHDTVSVDMQITYNTANSQLQVTRTLQSAIARVSAATFDSDLVPNSAYNFSLGQSSKGWGSVYVGDGAAGTPPYTFGSQTNLGMFRPAADTLGFSTQGIERMRIGSSGSVGIGTASPQHKFEIAPPTAGILSAAITNIDTGSGSYAEFDIANGTSTYNDALRFTTLGQGWNDYFAFKRDGAIIFTDVNLLGGLSIMTRANVPMRFYTNGETNERMRIAADGNIGIGTDTPGEKLSVNGNIENFGGSDGFKIKVLNSWSAGWANRGMTFRRESDNAVLGMFGGYGVGNPMTLTYLYVGTDYLTPWATFLSNGNVGIGQAAPDQKLQISGGNVLIDNNYGYRIKDSLGTQVNAMIMDSGNHLNMVAGSNGDIKFAPNVGNQGIQMVIRATSGNVGIGSLTPMSKLQVGGGDIYVEQAGSGIILKNAGGQCYRVYMSGATPTSVLITCP